MPVKKRCLLRFLYLVMLSCDSYDAVNQCKCHVILFFLIIIKNYGNFGVIIVYNNTKIYFRREKMKRLKMILISACAAALTVGEINAYAYSDNSFADIENILTFFAL